MFAHDLCHSQIEYLKILSILIEKTERSDTTNRQYSIVNIQFGSGLSGLGITSYINNVFDKSTIVSLHESPQTIPHHDPLS